MPEHTDIHVEDHPTEPGRHMLSQQDGIGIAPTHLDVTRIRIKPDGNGWQARIEFRICDRDDTATKTIEAESLPLLLFELMKAIMASKLVPFCQYKLWWGLYRLK